MYQFIYNFWENLWMFFGDPFVEYNAVIDLKFLRIYLLHIPTVLTFMLMFYIGYKIVKWGFKR